MKTFYLIVFFILTMLPTAMSQAAFSIQGNLCLNTELQFVDQSVIEASAWVWDFGDGTGSNLQNPKHTFADIGTYTINLTITKDATNYTANAQTVRISAIPAVDFIVDSTIFFYSTYSRTFIDTSITENAVAEYIWNFGDGSELTSTTDTSILYKYNNKGTYTAWLKLIDIKGCSDSISKTFEIYDRYYIPNVFTPNHDGINDEFCVTSNGITLFSIEIYSRWGNLIFKREGHQQIVWDGLKADGSLVNPGTYYYVINSESGNVNYAPETGFITVFH